MRKTRTYPLKGSLFAPCPFAKNDIPGYKLSLANACKTRGAPTSDAIAEDNVAAKQPAKIKYPVKDIFAICWKYNDMIIIKLSALKLKRLTFNMA